MRTDWKTASAAVALGAASIAACSSSSKQPLPDWSAGYPTSDAGVVDSGAADSGEAGPLPSGGFGITVPSSVDYPSRLRIEGTSSKPCTLTPAGYLDGGPNSDVACVLDMDELDLYVQGFKVDVDVPQGACDYVLYVAYMYATFPVGVGPTMVSYTVNADGTYANEVNAVNGVPSCAYDHRNDLPPGPNCCSGSYTLTVTHEEADAGPTVTTTTQDWGGPDAACYDGGAFWLDGGKLDKAGFPVNPIWDVQRQAAVIPIHVDGISDKPYPLVPGIDRPTIVPIANYWKELGLASAPAAETAPGAHPYYEILCMDNAAEVLGRIHLDVRSWTLKSQLAQDGDADITGAAPYWDAELDDYPDWADLAKQGIDYTRVLRPQ